MTDISDKLAEKDGKLDLGEKIAIEFSREEWATILVGIAYIGGIPGGEPVETQRVADRISTIVQEKAAPVGVLVRTLRKHNEAGRP